MAKKIAIIGGGLAGMTLAYRLLKNGFEVTIFEKSDHLGGLAAGFEIYGTHLEQAYHHIFKTDSAIIDLAKELGIEDKIVWKESSVAVVSDGKIQKFSTAKDLLNFKGLGIVDKLRLGATALLLQKDDSWQKYHNITAWNFMEKALGKKAFSSQFEPLLRGKFYGFAKKVSMSWLWARIHTRTNSKSEGREMLGYFDGGFNVLIARLQAEIKRMGGKIILDKMLTELPRARYNSVIFTGPSGIFANLIKNEKETTPQYLYKLKSVNYLGAICMVFSTSQSLSKYYWHNINNKDSPFLAFIQHTNLIHKENYAGKNIYYAGVYTDDTEQDIETKWLDYIKNIFPNFDKRLVDKKWIFRLKNAQHVVECGYMPVACKTPLKNVFLMNFSQIFPEDRGTNFAVAEAEKLYLALGSL